MAPKQSSPSRHSTARSRGRGFAAAGQLVAQDIRKATESRGVSLARIITRWDHIVGEDLARLCFPLRVKSHRQSLGATLLIETSSAAASLVSAQKQLIIDRVNAAFGYAAIDRISLQHGRSKFAKPDTNFAKPSAKQDAAKKAAVSFNRPRNDDLASQLERLAQQIANRVSSDT